ncbi:hypothetical protein AAULR_11470, partial [Lacticaseibacillus rhamnosus MTCC 5462]
QQHFKISVGGIPAMFDFVGDDMFLKWAADLG